MREIKFRAWDIANNSMEYQFEIGAGNGRTFFDGKPTQYWELMLYSNVKDVNGANICEGDICNVTANKDKNEGISDDLGVLPIVWVNGGFFLKGYSNSLGWQCDNLDVKIIGNIYESPELLTPKQ